ncbi:hypothetical protein E2C01_065142 [Portunus trituberculatus]|uniref:Uncharacterized protein n=1 Tax=Portunus trituberculatus TaxID=210409 RepID=A0A5B7HEV9_PORTR|nr:hypothetical protein [Portunus trituberculatus]
MKRREDTGSCDVPGRWTAAFQPAADPRGMAVTISSNVSMLRPSSSQEVRSETEGVTEGWTETTGATIPERSIEDSQSCAPRETLEQNPSTPQSHGAVWSCPSKA